MSKHVARLVVIASFILFAMATSAWGSDCSSRWIPRTEFKGPRVYQPAYSCRGGATEEAKALSRRIERLFPTGLTPRGIGLYNCRRIAGTKNLSVHAAGRALDVFAKNKREGDRIANYLSRNANRLGVQLIIWRSTIVSNRWSKSKCYRGRSPHDDHVHVEVVGRRGLQRVASGRPNKNINRRTGRHHTKKRLRSSRKRWRFTVLAKALRSQGFKDTEVAALLAAGWHESGGEFRKNLKGSDRKRGGAYGVLQATKASLLGVGMRPSQVMPARSDRASERRALQNTARFAKRFLLGTKRSSRSWLVRARKTYGENHVRLAQAIFAKWQSGRSLQEVRRAYVRRKGPVKPGQLAWVWPAIQRRTDVYKRLTLPFVKRSLLDRRLASF